MRNLGISVLTALLGTSSAYAQTKTVNITVSKNVTHPISKSLYGYMWEDINHSGDGGLYGELIMNRAFQTVEAGNDTAYYAWMPVSDVSLAVTNSSAGVSSALPNSLQVSIPKNAKSPSFANVGYWGFKVQSGWTYNGSFWARSDDYTGSVKVSLRTNSTSSKGKVYATATPAKKIGKKWTKYTFTFKPTSSAPDQNNMFEVELTQSSKAATVYFGMFSLFPPTYKGRENGMRIDLAEAMAGTQPRLWRFPGGNNLEGLSFDSRWKWNKTIGPLENRPGRIGNWGYPNTDGLGLIEYMNWAEDLNATVILGVWDGIATGDYSNLPTWPVVPQDQLQPYIDDAIHQISFLTDRADESEWGALRAKYGRQEPYPLYYVEIGNEDTFQEASYQAYRWNMFRTQLGARFPTIQFLSTANPSAGLTPAYTKIDYHVYQSPNWFTNATEMFDNYPRNGTQFFVGEYAVTAINDTNALPDPSVPEWGRLLYPTIQGASAEAAFMTGFERNSDIVFASAYAPSLQHINSTQWTPDIITFDAQKLVRSASYYNQQLFATNLGTHSLATNPPNANSTAPLFFAASKNENKNTAIIKVSNAGPDAIASTWSLDFKASSPAQATVLAGPGEPSAHNDLENMNVVVPKEATVSVADGNTITHTFPAYSVTVLVLNVTSW